MTREQQEKFDSVKDLESVKNFKVEALEIAGLHSVLETLHLPYGGENKSESKADCVMYLNDDNELVMAYSGKCKVSEKDIKLIHNLIKNGDEHGKVIRGLLVWAQITAPRGWWQEMVTYEVGTIKMGSNSTMHQECKGMSTRELVEAKEEIKEGLMQTRTHCFSYQTLRRIYRQRHNHRLPYWWLFCDWIEKLPFADEWITFGLKDEEKGE